MILITTEYSTINAFIVKAEVEYRVFTEALLNCFVCADHFSQGGETVKYCTRKSKVQLGSPNVQPATYQPWDRKNTLSNLSNHRRTEDSNKSPLIYLACGVSSELTTVLLEMTPIMGLGCFIIICSQEVCNFSIKLDNHGRK